MRHGKYYFQLAPKKLCTEVKARLDILLDQGWPNHCPGAKSVCQDIFMFPLNFFENYIK